MKKDRKKLILAKETIRDLISDELQNANGGATSCGAASACDCSTGASFESSCVSNVWTKPQY